MTILETFLWLIFLVVVFVVAVWLVRREVGGPRTYGLQREVNLRLTYKRYIELYPSNLSYEEYKRMQAARAYKKAVSSTKIKRMVR
jgi:hypothetical protein